MNTFYVHAFTIDHTGRRDVGFYVSAIGCGDAFDVANKRLEVAYRRTYAEVVYVQQMAAQEEWTQEMEEVA